MALSFLIAYDIADDQRRDDVATLLAAHGPRVQLSVFEAALPDKPAARALREALRTLIDPDEDQIRLYPLTPTALNETVILGNHRLEERADFWII